MITLGYTLSSEEHGPTDLVDHARRAEEAGFEFASISDHFHPWVGAQGHSPFVWATLGALAQATDDLELAVGVTCPILRMHPALVAQAAATTSLLSGGRFTLGVGTGEALNEHIVGARWPSAPVRREMLAEAVDVIRELWTGETVNHRGEHFEVENARIFDPPTEELPIVISGFGPEAAKLAGELGDGYWGTAPEPDLLEAFAAAGGSGPRYGQVNLCWATDADDARKTAHEFWPNAGLAGQLSQDLPTWHHFEQASEPLSMEDTTRDVPCGPDPEPVIESIRKYVDAGYDHVYLHQIGPDQRGFFEFWERELRPSLDDLDLGLDLDPN